jgi:uncharacterized protein YaiL (DUF2058 family)
MSDSLRDQLLKSGLVQKLKPDRGATATDKSARPVRPGKGATPSRPPERTPRPAAAPNRPAQAEPTPHEHDLARAYALRARLEREERERAQREAERASREKKERKQKLAALLAGKALNAADADLPRHFPHGNKIRRVYCTADQLARLNRGELAVVQLAGRYLLVDAAVAHQAQAIQPETLVLLCDPNAPAEDDVPADIVW